MGEQTVLLDITTPVGTGICTLRAVIEREASLAVTPTSMDFGEGATSDQVELRNTGGEELEWDAAPSETWISLSPTSGTIDPGGSNQLIVRVDRQGQAAGDLVGQISVNSSGGNSQVSVRATVSAVALLGVTPRSLAFGAAQNRLDLELRVTGANVDWTAESSDSWLQPERTSGAVLLGQVQVITIRVDRSQLSVGSHQGQVTIKSLGGNVTVAVNVTIEPAPQLGLSVTSIDLGTDGSAVLRISNTGTGSLSWQLTEDVDWLVLDRIEGSATDLANPVTLTIVREGLRAADYVSTISVTSNGGNQDIGVTMRVPLPSIRIISGPGNGEVVHEDSLIWEIAAADSYDEAEFSARIDNGNWSDWSTRTRFGFGTLEETSLFGPHVMEARTRTSAGESAVEVRSVSVDAVQGPAIRVAPMRIETSPGEEVTVSIVLEEVTGILGGNVILTFDSMVVEVTDATFLQDAEFLEGATVISPSITIESARVEIGFAAAGLDDGINGTGAILELTVAATASGAIEVSAESTLRDLSNQSIPLNFRGSRILVE